MDSRGGSARGRECYQGSSTGFIKGSDCSRRSLRFHLSRVIYLSGNWLPYGCWGESCQY